MVSVVPVIAAAILAQSQILFDTDSGFFGDDGVALTMLMRSPLRSRVRLVSIVPGNVWTNSGAGYMTRNLRLLRASRVPVHAGAQRPLLHTASMVKLEQPVEFSGALGLAPEPDVPSAAIAAMARVIDAAPEPVTILAIGPLTNIAMLLRLYPRVESRIGTLVIMGGQVEAAGNATRSAEFNFWFDPEAASIVLRSAVSRKVLFALDVCNKIRLTRDVFDAVTAVRTPITELYREDFGNRYPGFLKNPQATGSLWDELAAAFLIDHTVVTGAETRYLDVDSSFGSRYGATMPLDRALSPQATPVEVVRDMDFTKVLDIYKRALTAR